MNREICHGSLEEIESLNARREIESLPPEVISAYRKGIVQVMEEYNPGSKIAHELAKKYAYRK